MASGYFDVKVDGFAELSRNLASFGDDKIVGKIIRAAMQAGGRVARPKGASNARALGLGAQGLTTRAAPHGGTYATYGRIPRSIKVGRAYIPKGQPDLYRVNVVARGQRGPGIRKNAAPHALLIEYGFTVRGRHIAGRPFLGPALDSTAAAVVAKIADTMRARIDALRLPT